MRLPNLMPRQDVHQALQFARQNMEEMMLMLSIVVHKAGGKVVIDREDVLTDYALTVGHDTEGNTVLKSAPSESAEPTDQQNVQTAADEAIEEAAKLLDPVIPDGAVLLVADEQEG